MLLWGSTFVIYKCAAINKMSVNGPIVVSLLPSAYGESAFETEYSQQYQYFIAAAAREKRKGNNANAAAAAPTTYALVPDDAPTPAAAAAAAAVAAAAAEAAAAVVAEAEWILVEAPKFRSRPRTAPSGECGYLHTWPAHRRTPRHLSSYCSHAQRQP